MIVVVKNIVNNLIKIGRKATPEFSPISSQLIHAAENKGKQQPPVNLSDLPVYMQEWFEEEVLLPDQFIYTFDNVTVSWHGVVLLGLRIFIPSLAYPTFTDEFSGAFLLRQWISKRIKVDRPIALVYDHWAFGNYYHWLVDTLPRLLLLKEQHPNCLLLVAEPVRDYVRLTTRALGFNMLHEVPAGSFTQANQLVMPSHVSSPGKQDGRLISKVRTELLRAVTQDSQKITAQKKWVYVSRNKQKSRRLANEIDIAALLEEFGIETIHFEGMSFEQQIESMRNVDVLIGLHGANLTNMLFLKPGAKVIELLNKEICNLCYFQLASNLKFSYYAVPCSPVTNTGSSDIANSNDVLLDVASLRRILVSL